LCAQNQPWTCYHKAEEKSIWTGWNSIAVCNVLNEEEAILEENSNTLAGFGGMAFFLDKLVMVPPAIAPVVGKRYKRHKDLTKVTFLFKVIR
jgi:hypothetical protein